MSDRELLELAAKAAGIEGEYRRIHQTYGDEWIDGIKRPYQPIFWNPLTDDGDALRLAVELRIEIRPYWKFVEAESGIGCASEKCKDEPYSRNAATRRAIVLAAAEIGRAMP